MLILVECKEASCPKERRSFKSPGCPFITLASRQGVDPPLSLGLQPDFVSGYVANLVSGWMDYTMADTNRRTMAVIL